MIIKVCYFARFRERLGVSEEELSMPASSTIEQVLEHLRQRGQPWAALFAPDQTVLVALNHAMVKKSCVLQQADELAFFPPVTGG